MNNLSYILKFLEENRGNYVSGEVISHALNISRQAVSKAIKVLKEDGYNINSVHNLGHKLDISNNIISPEGVISKLTSLVDLPVFVYDVVTSTSDVAKDFANQSKEAVIIANSQSNGRGRMGRTFYSPKNSGLYMSFSLRATGQNPSDYTVKTAVCVALAIESIYGVKCDIKWVNDVLVSHRKVCGILTEGIIDLENNNITFVVIGIGVNVFTDNFPVEISNIAGSISSIPTDRQTLAAKIIDNFFTLSPNSIRDAYISRSIVIGKNVSFLLNGQSYSGVVTSIDSTYGLEVMCQNQLIKLSSGEVSIKSDFYI